MDDKAKFWVDHSDKKIIDIDGSSKNSESHYKADESIPSKLPMILDLTHFADSY